MRERTDDKPQKVHGSCTTIKFYGVILSSKIHIVSEAVTDKVQAYPTPKNMREVPAFVGILGLWKTFLPHLAQCLHPLHHLVKKGYVWDWGSEHQATFQKAKILVKQTKVLGISQAGYHLGRCV